ncbi:MAG: hypothetical protein MR893_09910 [Prevotellaceae bacterium]|nr:hypothetical protein [Prevotellaceae bacterium]
MTKISITIGIKKRFQKKSTKSQTILPISIYPLTTARTKKGKRGKREKREKRRVSIRKREKKREKGKKKKREGVPRIPARNPLSQEGGDLLSRIAVQYHRRARA